MKKMIYFLLLALIASTALGCGTIRGIGEDIGTLGRWLVRGSDKATQTSTEKATK